MQKFAAFALAAGLALQAGAAAAQQLSDADRQAIRNACASDMRAHCRCYISGTPTREAIQACMRDQEAKFSAGCRNALAAAGLKGQ